MNRENNILVTVSDKEIGFRIDNWVLKETQRKSGCKGIIELLIRIGVDDSNIDMEAFSILLMEAFNEYQYYTKGKLSIDQRGACELIDDMGGIVSALQKISEGLLSYVPKNSPALQTVGQ
jgi:hypothetical protein